MCSQTRDQINGIHGGLWLIGIATLLYTGFWWPGILFVCGVISVVVGLLERRGWLGLQGGLWCIGIGLWALMNYSFVVILIAIGLSMIVGAIVRPPMYAKKPPAPDTSLA